MLQALISIISQTNQLAIIFFAIHFKNSKQIFKSLLIL